MASIYIRKGRFNVVWKYQKDDGSWGQKWESFESEEEAKIRKAELEFQKATNNMIVPNNISVKDFMLQKFFPVYGTKKWSPKTYETNMGLSQNHIFPHIGQKPIQGIKPFDIEVLNSILAKTKKGQYIKGRKQDVGNKDTGFLSKKTIRESLLVL